MYCILPGFPFFSITIRVSVLQYYLEGFLSSVLPAGFPFFSIIPPGFPFFSITSMVSFLQYYLQGFLFEVFPAGICFYCIFSVISFLPGISFHCVPVRFPLCARLSFLSGVLFSTQLLTQYIPGASFFRSFSKFSFFFLSLIICRSALH